MTFIFSKLETMVRFLLVRGMQNFYSNKIVWTCVERNI